MKLIHKNLTKKKWFKLSFYQQMANIGSEVFRTLSWKKKNKEYGRQAFFRSLELMDLTVADQKNKKRLKELLRCRELWVDYIFGKNQYQQNDLMWQNYFLSFNWAARR